MKNKYIYIVLTKTDTNVAKIIRLISKKTYSHSSVSADVMLSEMYSLCRDYIYSPLPAHFNVERIDKSVFGAQKNIPCEVYRVPVTDEQFAEFKCHIEHFVTNRTQYAYNIAAFLPMALHIPYKFDNKFVCSVWVGFILGKIGINYCSHKHPSLIEPEDLRNIENAELIFKGNLKKYPEFMRKKLMEDISEKSLSIDKALPADKSAHATA